MSKFSRAGVGIAIAFLVNLNCPADQSASTWNVVLDVAPDPAVITDASIRERIVATGSPWRVRDIESGIEMLLIPPGKFMMGASIGDADATAAEQPAHEVMISKPFYLSRTEVTQDQWMKMMGANPSRFQPSEFLAAATATREKQIVEITNTGLTRQEAEQKLGPMQVPFAATANWPVESMTQEQLQSFLQKTHLQLPTEAQWEYACRAGTTSVTYSSLDTIAWCGANSQEHTHPVATKVANGFGMYDMLGNVWEWCRDSYSADSYVAGKGGITDPSGLASGAQKVIRGGNWLSLPKTCRASYRIASAAGHPAYGFRVARNVN